MFIQYIYIRFTIFVSYIDTSTREYIYVTYLN